MAAERKTVWRGSEEKVQGELTEKGGQTRRNATDAGKRTTRDHG